MLRWRWLGGFQRMPGQAQPVLGRSNSGSQQLLQTGTHHRLPVTSATLLSGLLPATKVLPFLTQLMALQNSLPSAGLLPSCSVYPGNGKGMEKENQFYGGLGGLRVCIRRYIAASCLSLLQSLPYLDQTFHPPPLAGATNSQGSVLMATVRRVVRAARGTGLYSRATTPTAPSAQEATTSLVRRVTGEAAALAM